MTLNQVRTTVDNWLADKWSIVQTRQSSSLINRGMYWQGLITHTVIPVFTTLTNGDSIPDRVIIKPSDELYTWNDIMPEWVGTLLPCAFVMNVYDGPQGKGYVGTVYVRYNGTLYSRSRNVGPETSRNVAWHVVTES